MIRAGSGGAPPSRAGILYTFEIVIEKEAGAEGYTAYSPTLPGCFTRAPTLEEVRRRIRRVVWERVESLLAQGQPVRQSEDVLRVEELMIAVRE
jgi:predicted RNase H-like HicB family nuclease